MYNLNFKNTRKGYLFGLLFFSIGIVTLLLLSWVTFGGMIKKISLDAQTQATHIENNCHTDSEGDYLCSPVFYYNVNGERFTCRTEYSSSIGVSASQRKVYYDSKNPQNCVTDYEVKKPIYMYLFILIPLIFIVVGIVLMSKVRKKIKKMKFLAENGQLVKNLNYTMEPTNITVNGAQLYAIAIDYTLPSGSTIHLVGDPRYDRRVSDADGFVDLLIDPNDLNNYYIDFNIDRK